jgi:predicted N-formylglutamate amidohydrolase
MYSQEQINDLLEAAKPSIIEGLKKEIKQSITYQMQEAAAKAVREHTTNWITENVIPEITKELVESKEGLVALGAKLAPVLLDSLTESFADTIKKKMESSWERKKVFEALLG